MGSREGSTSSYRPAVGKLCSDLKPQRFSGLGLGARTVEFSPSTVERPAAPARRPFAGLDRPLAGSHLRGAARPPMLGWSVRFTPSFLKGTRHEISPPRCGLPPGVLRLVLGPGQ